MACHMDCEGGKMAELKGFVQSLKGLSAAELMEKKDAIEKDIKEFNEVLQSVRDGMRPSACAHI